MAAAQDNLTGKQIYISALQPETVTLRVAADCSVSTDSEDQLLMIGRILRLHKWVNKSWGTMKIEKVVELKPYRGGLKITAGNEKSPKPLENK